MNETVEVLDLLTSGDVSRMFGVTKLTVRNWRNAGLPYVRVVGDDRDTIRYRTEAVMRWARETGRRPEFDANGRRLRHGPRKS